jgi:hypothetical protein
MKYNIPTLRFMLLKNIQELHKKSCQTIISKGRTAGPAHLHDSKGRALSSRPTLILGA